jgi:hypothetical protein
MKYILCSKILAHHVRLFTNEIAFANWNMIYLLQKNRLCMPGHFIADKIRDWCMIQGQPIPEMCGGHVSPSYTTLIYR